jgi:MoaA/NifB/PqqE/SkfB family radical SAM enzyme
LVRDIFFLGRYDFVYDQMSISTRHMSMKKRWNLLKAGNNFIYRKLKPWNMPLHMQFELTNFCNLRCPVCPTGLGVVNRRPHVMDVGLFQRVVDEVGPYLLTLSLWGWGEPLLHPQLSEILKAIRNYPIATLLSTNGQNLDGDRVIEALINYPPTYLIVAIDGLTDETNAQFRVGAKLAPVLNGVQRLAEIKKKRALELPILHMRSIVMKHNQHELPHLFDFAKEHGFDLLTIRTLSIIDSENPDAVHGGFVPDVSGFRAYDYHDGGRVRRGDYICQEPFWFPTVFADGTLVACEQDYNAQQPMGKIAQGKSFGDLWFGKQATQVRRIIRDTPETVSFCKNCPYSDRSTTDVSVQALFLRSELPDPIVITR